MKDKTHWTKKNRFDSFAPIRLNVAAQWLVDGVCDLVSSLVGARADSLSALSPLTSERLLLEP